MLHPAEHAALNVVDALWERAMTENFFSENLYQAHAEAVKVLERFGYSEAFMQRLYSQQLDILSKPDAGPTIPTRMVEDGDPDW